MPTRSEVLRAKVRAVGGARPRCRRGKSCSAACINRDKHCLVDAPTPVAGALPKAVRAIQSRKSRPTVQANNSADYAEEDLTEELTEEEKLFYQMIWGRRWDDVYPSEGGKG